MAVIARQAIVNEARDVFGYELFDRSTAQHAHTAASDAALLFNALSYAGAEALVGKKTVFINCTHDSLAGGHLELIHPDKVVLEVTTLGENATTADIEERLPTFQALRQRGFRLAFNQHLLRRAYASWLPAAAFIKLDMQTFALADAETLVNFARAHTNAQIVAEKVETSEQFERMRDLGVRLFQGFWFAQPQLVQARTIRPTQATIIQLINLVRQQASTDEIEALLKKDPTLSFNLLRFINSSGFGLSCEITSFRHAVMILGLKKLFRWAALLLTTSRAGGTPPAVGQTAVVRGRLMEPADGRAALARGMRQRLRGGRVLAAGRDAGPAHGKGAGIHRPAPARDRCAGAQQGRVRALPGADARLRKRRRRRLCARRQRLAAVQSPGQLGAPAGPGLGRQPHGGRRHGLNGSATMAKGLRPGSRKPFLHATRRSGISSA